MNYQRDWDLVNDVSLLHQLLKQAQASEASAPNNQAIEIASRLAVALKAQLSGEPNSVNSTINDTIIDSFANKVFNLNNPFSQGTIYLYGKDLADEDALSDWLKTSPMATVINADGQQLPFVASTGQEGDRCIIVNILAQRAARQFANGNKYRKGLAKYYQDKISSIAPKFSGLDGKPCQIGKQNAEAHSESPSMSFQELSTFPVFNSEYINLDNIQSFADNFVKLANNNEVNAAAQKITNAIRNAKGLMSSPLSLIKLDDMSVDKFYLITPKNRAQQLAYALEEVISDAGALYTYFVSQYGRNIPGGATPMMEGQVVSGGPQATNMGQLLQLKKDLDIDWNQGYRK